MVRKTIITSTLAALGLSLLFFAGCRPPGHHGGAEFMIDYMSEALDLTDAQQDQLDEIKQEMFAKAAELHQQKKAQHEEFIALLQAEEIDPARLKTLVARHRAQMDQMVDLAVDRVVAFHATLSAEQKEKLVRKIEKFYRFHGRGYEQ